MNIETTTYTNGLGELLAPVLRILRWIGFFEAYVFMPLMTIASIVLFMRLRKVMKKNHTMDNPLRFRYKIILLSAYYSLCFIATNATAVALKTLILEEMDYETPVWFSHLVSPLHFYITSVAAAFIWLIWRNKSTITDQFLCIYIQIGMLGGYYTAIHRLTNEPFELTDVTTGMSGIFFILWFGIINTDLLIRFKQKYRVKHAL